MARGRPAIVLSKSERDELESGRSMPSTRPNIPIEPLSGGRSITLEVPQSHNKIGTVDIINVDQRLQFITYPRNTVEDIESDE